jgi:hypothetical protein
MSGVLFGGVAGILRSSSPTIFAIVSGIQWFTLGSTYWGTYRADKYTHIELFLISKIAARGIMLNVLGRDKIKPSEMISASTIAGGIAGCAGGLLRMTVRPMSPTFSNSYLGGRRNIVPGAIVFALLGGAGQTIYNLADAQHSAYLNSPAKFETRSRWLDSKWSPVKVLSDDEYEAMLQEKLLRLKAEIALIDENIAELKNYATQDKALQEDEA